MTTPPPVSPPDPEVPPHAQPGGPPPAPAAAPDPFAVVADAVDGMREELASLGDQFRRRLLNDREIHRGLDGMVTELDRAHKAAEGRIVQPLLYDLVLLLDRIERQAAQDDALAASVATELSALLQKYGMTRIPVTRGTFDAEIQEAVGAIPALSPEQNGEVAEIVRQGYRMGERVVRPQQVRVYTER